jgi:peptide methionine sulfoxide reductase MsrB
MIDVILSELNKKGYFILEDFYTEYELDMIEKEFDRIFDQKKDKVEILVKEKCSEDERIFHAEKYSPYIKQNFSDRPLFNNVCREYTKKEFNKKTLINKLLYEEGKIKNSGAGWHRDNHNCQFKVIMYLSDVTEKNGNFQILSNSSKRHIGYPEIRDEREGGTRYSDENIKKIIDTRDCEIINIVGKKGTIIIADTTYIHRGNIILEGERKAITQYFF